MVCWPFMARHWEGVVFPIDPCYFWAPLGMTPREDIDSSLNASLGSGEMAELRLEVICLHWDMWYSTDTCIFFQAWACVLLGVSYFASQKQRGFETPVISVLFRRPAGMRRWFLCQGSQTQLFPCAMQGVYTWSWSAMEAVDCIPRGTAQNPCVSPGLWHWPPSFAVWRLPASGSSLLSTDEGTSGAP